MLFSQSGFPVFLSLYELFAAWRVHDKLPCEQSAMTVHDSMHWLHYQTYCTCAMGYTTEQLHQCKTFVGGGTPYLPQPTVINIRRLGAARDCNMPHGTRAGCWKQRPIWQIVTNRFDQPRVLRGVHHASLTGIKAGPMTKSVLLKTAHLNSRSACHQNKSTQIIDLITDHRLDIIINYVPWQGHGLADLIYCW